MALKDGDVVRFDYTLWIEGDKKPLDTSIQAVAQAEGIAKENRTYKPMTVALGTQTIIPGLESHIRSHGQKGRTVTVTLSPAEGYGERHADKIKTIPMAQFKSQKVEPRVGMELNLQGARGIVTRVDGGRVRVDTNHDLAGKTLRYEYTVRDVLTDDRSKVEAVLENFFGAGAKFEVSADTVTVELPDSVKFAQDWTMAKFRVLGELRNATGKAKTIRLVEVYPVIKDTPPAAESTSDPAAGAGPATKASAKNE